MQQMNGFLCSIRNKIGKMYGGNDGQKTEKDTGSDFYRIF